MGNVFRCRMWNFIRTVGKEMTDSAAVVTEEVNPFITDLLMKFANVDGCNKLVVKWNLYAKSSVLASLGVLCAYVHAKELTDCITNFGENLKIVKF